MTSTTFFERLLASCSTPDGLMLLQAITIDDRAYEVEKASQSFINQLIFPGGCLPSQEVIAALASRATTDLRVVQLEDITAALRPRRCAPGASASSPPSAELARARLRRALPPAVGRSTSRYCEAGFAERRIRDVQMLLAKPRFRDEPLALVQVAAVAA